MSAHRPLRLSLTLVSPGPRYSHPLLPKASKRARLTHLINSTQCYFHLYTITIQDLRPPDFHLEN